MLSLSDNNQAGYLCADPEGETGPDPPEKSQKYRVSLQYWSRSPEKITKQPCQHLILGHHQPASETPFKTYNGAWILSPLIK